MGAYFARTEAHRSYALAVTLNGERPADMYISVDSPTRSLRTAGGDHLIVGGEGHKVGERHDTSEHYRNLESWARHHFNVATIDHRWSAQDWSASDNLPYIGRMAGHDDGVFVATAFRKWGMTHGTIAAVIIRDLIAGRDNPWLDVYDATRIAPKQILKGLISENVSALKHFIGDRLHTDDRDAIEQLPAGDGTVARVSGQDIAAFRDDNGELHAVSAVCTHLGCLVNFNSAERSWDCPCHGSRFTIDGEVLEGPAVDDLAGETLS
jgi:nitrite reductase/ring-hydroxylating ferredoxin subunit